MRQSGKNNRQRGRSRRSGNGQINRNTTLDSNGPDVRLRGNALQLHEKYVSLGNDASSAGERISAEAYYQHADHYFRVHSAIVSSQEDRRPGQAENGAATDTPAEQQAEQQAEADGNSDTAAEPVTESKTGEAKASKSNADDGVDTDDSDDAISQRAS